VTFSPNICSASFMRAGVGSELSLPEARRWLEAAADKSNAELPWRYPVCWSTGFVRCSTVAWPARR